MKPSPNTTQRSSGKAITIGVTCWLWEWHRYRAIIRLAQEVGVNLHLTQHCHGLRRHMEGQVSGENVDRFIFEFARHG